MKNRMLFLTLFCLLSLTGCFTQEPINEPKAISFNKTKLSLPLGLSHPLTVNALLPDGSINDISNSPEVKFIVDDTQLAYLDDNTKNIIVGRSIGKSSITALAKFNSVKHQSSIELVITPPVIKELSLESASTEIMADVPLILQVTATMTDGSKVNVTDSSTLEWEVDQNNAEITSSEEGIVLTGIEEGELKVSVTTDSFPSMVTTHKTFTVISKDYTIKLGQDSSTSLERSIFKGYDLDDIKIQHNDSTSFNLLNSTPRYLNNPLVKINQQYFRIDALISPFQHVYFELPEWFDEPITTANFVEEQPFFKAHIRSYADVRPQDNGYAKPTEKNVYQYEKEIRGFKQLMNNYDYNYQFIGFIQNYMNSKTRTILDPFCKEETRSTSTRSLNSGSDNFVKFRGNDTAPHTLKHVSLIAHKPSAIYAIITPQGPSGVLGMATTSDGWLSARESTLFREGATAPRDVYIHEKMHTHGFGHNGGMTYGYPSQSGAFVRKHLKQFYEDGVLEASTPTLASQYEIKDLGDKFRLEISFLDKNASGPSNRRIDKFILLTTSLSKLKHSYVIDDKNNATEIFPDPTSGYDHTYVFNNIDNIKAQSLNEINFSKAVASKLAFIFDKPEHANQNNIPSSIVFIGGSEEDTKQQANLMINYSESGGFVSKDGLHVYLFKSWNKNDDNVFVNRANKYSPSEAEQICNDRGLTLGNLKPFRSRAMMDFQTQYQKYGSQVGLSYETGAPIAFLVPTTYNTPTIKEAATGAVIVCSK